MVNHVLDVWVRVVPDGWGDGGLVWGGRHTGGQPVTVHIDTLLNRVQLSQWETQTITQHLEKNCSSNDENFLQVFQPV